jgi:hypothetical protein
MVALRYLAMEEASAFDDETSLSVRANQVLAIVMDLDEVKGVVETLSDNGFSSEDIGVLTGTEDAEKLDAPTLLGWCNNRCSR